MQANYANLTPISTSGGGMNSTTPPAPVAGISSQSANSFMPAYPSGSSSLSAAWPSTSTGSSSSSGNSGLLSFLSMLLSGNFNPSMPSYGGASNYALTPFYGMGQQQQSVFPSWYAPQTQYNNYNSMFMNPWG